MEQGPSCEANSHPASEEIPRRVWNRKVQYCVHNSPSLVRICARCIQSTSFHCISLRSTLLFTSHRVLVAKRTPPYFNIL